MDAAAATAFIMPLISGMIVSPRGSRRCPRRAGNGAGLRMKQTFRMEKRPIPMKPFFNQPLTTGGLKDLQRGLALGLDTVLARRRMRNDELGSWRDATLRALLRYAQSAIPFYRVKWDREDFSADSVRSIDDLTRIPLTTKQELRTCKPIELRASSRGEDAYLLRTSGSTGMPVTLYKSRSCLEYFSAYAMALYWNWCNERPFNNVMYILDPTPHNIDHALAELLRATVMEERIVSTFGHIRWLTRCLDRFKPDYISSYPATMRNLAMHLLALNVTHPEVKLIHLTSEMLDGTTRKVLESAFPRARLVETYTTTEAGMIGVQCATHGGFHVLDEGLIVEILDDDDQPTSGAGRLVVTDLTNWATPVIRYSGLGDLAAWAVDACSCGAPQPRLASLEGRIVESVRRPDGSLLSPYALTNVLAAMQGILAYQIRQLRLDRFEVMVVRDAEAKSEDTLRVELTDGLKKVLGAVTCEVRFVGSIPVPPGVHKQPLVVSEVPAP
ncbi:phenylacetate--CoA ligase family protein [bacterium]|nr:phenylacetate--CoA ligase family protein [candidate division CSSED10-310 bacterium]